jgi:acyl-CoA synthetase (NDP forming)
MVLKPPALDPAYDILRTEQQALSALFAPKTVAVVGATDRPGSVGRTLLWNLISNPFGGTVFPVNPKRHSVLGIRAYASIRETPEPPDLVIIATPAPTVPGIIEDCVAVGVKGAIVLSAGFKEIGAAGIALEQRIRELLRHSPLRLIGPNCLGLMNPLTGLNATFASTMARPRQCGLHQPEWCPVYRRAGLELAGKCGLQRLRLHGLHAGCGLGRPDLLPGG